MRICNIRSFPVRLLAFALTAPILLIIFFVLLIVYSFFHSAKCATIEFVSYYNDKNVIITRKSIKAMLNSAWYGMGD